MKKFLCLLACLLIHVSFAVARAEEDAVFLPKTYEGWVIDQKTNWIDPDLYFATISNPTIGELRLIAGIRQADNELRITAETNRFIFRTIHRLRRCRRNSGWWTMDRPGTSG